jgi:hypothetical protein
MPIPTINDLKSQLSLGEPDAQETWRRFPIPGGGLSIDLDRVSTVLFGDSLLPAELPSTGLKLIGLRVNTAPGQEELQFSLSGTTGSWTLIRGVLELTNKDWSLVAKVKPDSRTATLGIGFQLGQADVDATITLPEAAFTAEVTSANKDTGLFRSLLGTAFDFLPTEPATGFEQLQIQSVSLEAAPKAKEYKFGIEIRDVWNAPGVDFHVTGIKLSLGHQGACKEEDRETSLSLSAKAQFAGATFEVSGDYPSKAEGWTLAGSVENLSIERALGALLVDTATLPDFVKGLEVTTASVSFETKTKNLTFAFEIKGSSFPFEVGSSSTAALRIDCFSKHNSDNTFQAEFTGQLTLGELELALVIDGATVVGTLVDEDGLVVNLGDVLTTLGAGAEVSHLGDSLDLVFNGAVFALLGKEGGISNSRKPRFLMGLDLANSINLSNLPLIGGAFGKDETLEAVYRLFFSSAFITAAELSRVNEIVQEKNLAPLPAPQPGSRFAVAVKVNIGSTAVDVTVPIPAAVGAAAGGPAGATPAPASPGANNINWIEIQRDFGPAHFGRAGIGFGGGTITFALDASLTVGPLSLGLVGLSVTSPLDRFAPTFNLDGIAVGFQQGAVDISGMFARRVADGTTTYSGLAVIALQGGKGGKAFSLSAFGSYTEGDQPSMFIFAVLDRILGGPSFFFVTGLAAGFGYNRDLTAPPIEGVAGFPLLAAADKPADFATAQAILPRMESVLRPQVGSYWLAAGIKFDSFKVIHSTALLLVKFGNNFELTLLGISRFQLPEKLAEGISPYVNVELQFKVSVRPEEGLVAAEALLTDNSFVIDKACRLTGGFAFYVWFDGTHKGDFVLTVGGYHPRFNVPAHYPRVPRLGLSWTVDNVSIKGEAYFALTPSAVMAGGSLEISYKDGTVEASLIARADFLIQWKPFFYDITVFVSIKAALLIETVFGTGRIGTELSAGVHIEGPEFRGNAHVEWSVISFDVPFGAQKIPVPDLTWQQFREAFLPPDADICKIKIVSGLVSEVAGPGGTGKEIVVRPDELAIATETVIPATQVILGTAQDQPDIAATKKEDVGILRLRTGPLVSTHTIRIQRLVGDTSTVERDEDLRFRWQLEAGGRRLGVPKELWSSSTEGASPSPSADVLANRLVGVGGLRPLVGLSRSNPPVLDILDAFQFAVRPTPFLLSITSGDSEAGLIETPLGAVNTSEDSYSTIKATIADPAVRRRRTTMITALRGAGFTDLTADEPLSRLASDAETVLQFAPMLGGLGSAGVQLPQVAAPVDLGEEPLVQVVLAALIQLIAEIFQWQAAAADSSTPTAGSVDLKKPGEGAQVITDQAQPETEPKQTLTAGQTLVWSVDRDEGSPEPDLSITGGDGMRTRVVAFDEFGRLLQDNETAAASVKLPAATARVTVTGIPAGGPDPVIFGWHGGSSLIQVSSRTMLAEGATVRVQVSFASQTAGKARVRLVSGANAARENVVTLVEGTGVGNRSGFFRTELPDTVQTLAVFVKQGEMNPAPALGTIVEVIRKSDGETLRLEPVYVIRESDSEFLLLYRIPAGLRRNEARRISVQVQAAGGPTKWEINGVQGINAPVFQVRRERQKFRLTPRVLSGAAAEGAKARVGFQKGVA